MTFKDYVSIHKLEAKKYAPLLKGKRDFTSEQCERIKEEHDKFFLEMQKDITFMVCYLQETINQIDSCKFLNKNYKGKTKMLINQLTKHLDEAINPMLTGMTVDTADQALELINIIGGKIEEAKTHYLSNV